MCESQLSDNIFIDYMSDKIKFIPTGDPYIDSRVIELLHIIQFIRSNYRVMIVNGCYTSLLLFDKNICNCNLCIELKSLILKADKLSHEIHDFTSYKPIIVHLYNGDMFLMFNEICYKLRDSYNLIFKIIKTRYNITPQFTIYIDELVGSC